MSGKNREEPWLNVTSYVPLLKLRQYKLTPIQYRRLKSTKNQSMQ